MAARLTTLEAQVAALAGTPAGTLGQVRTDLAALQTGITGLRSDLDALRGPQERNLSQLYTALYDGLYYQGEATNYPAHIRLNAELEDIAAQINHLQAGIGAQPYESLEFASVRGLLHALVTANALSVYGLPPFQTENDIGSDTFELYNGRKYALFYDDITNVTIASNNRDLTANWSGWSAYIQTNAPKSYIAGAVDYTNVWVGLVGSGVYNFAVDAEYNIKVFLRPPVQGETIFHSVYSTQGGSNHFQVISNLDWATLGYTPLAGINWTIPPWAQGNAFGRRIKLTGGQSVRMQLNLSSSTTTLTQGEQQIRVNTTSFNIIGADSSPFSIEILDPEM